METSDNSQVVENSLSAVNESPSSLADLSAMSEKLSQPQTTSTQPVESSQPQPAQVPAYTPNFKFSVLKKEYEVPEAFRAVIKDPETEKLVKEHLEKAYGLDHVKSERTRLNDEYKTYRQKADPILNIAEKLNYHQQKGDLTGYFQTLGLSKDQIFQWAVQQAEIDGLPPEQKQVYDQHREADLRAYQLEQQFQMQQQKLESLQVQSLESEMSFAMSKPDVQSFQQAFDQRNGEGAFRDEVIKRGQLYWHTQGVDVPPSQVVQELMTRFGSPQSPVQSQIQQQPLQAVQTQNTAPQKREVPVIPNTGSGSVSPAAKSPQSLDDLRRISQEKYG